MEAIPLFDLKEQFAQVEDDVRRAMESVFDSQRFVMGPEVEALEEAFRAAVGVPHAVACASGTDALLLPLKALQAETGDEAVVPAFTFFATAGAVWNAGLAPVFCDVDEATFNVTADTVAEALGERTRAVVPVHLYGQMAPVEAIRALPGMHGGVLLLEDAAQATGATRQIEGREVAAGAAGDAGAFSFFPTKNLGGFGEGGMVTVRDDELAEDVRKLRVHGGRQMYHHEMVGTNSRLHTLQAAVLLAKLPRLQGWIEARRRHAAVYDAVLADVPGVRIPVVAPGNHHTYNQYTLRVEGRDALREALQGQGIGTGLYYPVPLHLQPCFAELGGQEGRFPVAERLCGEVVSLPVYPELGEERAARVAEAVRGFYGR